MDQTLSIPAIVGAIDEHHMVIHVRCVSAEHVFVATAHQTETPEQVFGNNAEVSLMYLKEEFPSQWPHVYSTVSHSLAKFFVSFLPRDARIRDVLWAFEPHLLRVWTVIDEPDFGLEEPIYEAQRRFLDKIDDLACDFAVIYAFGKSITEIRPTGAFSVK